jgi:peptidyl-prolyl cis-trans isomerase C
MKRRLALVASILLLSGVVAAATPDPATVVLAENGTVKLTRADYDAEVSKLPPDSRAAFATDPRRVGALVDNLLLMKTLAAQARNGGEDRRADVQYRANLEQSRLLATVRMEDIEQKARAEFDTKRVEFEARARELYRAGGAAYDVPETLKVAQILFRVDRRGKEPAEAAAREALAKLRSGADFTMLARQLSDDPTAKKNGGELGWLVPGTLEPEFAKAASALGKEGALSEPVQTRYGIHIIKLEGRRPAGRKPFDEVREDLMRELRNGYIDEKKNDVVAAIRGDPKLKVNQEAMDAIVQQVDPGLFATPLVPLATKSQQTN